MAVLVNYHAGTAPIKICNMKVEELKRVRVEQRQDEDITPVIENILEHYSLPYYDLDLIEALATHFVLMKDR